MSSGEPTGYFKIHLCSSEIEGQMKPEDVKQVEREFTKSSSKVLSLPYRSGARQFKLSIIPSKIVAFEYQVF